MSTRNALPHIKLYNGICEYFPTDYSGTFVEVGAADPVDISVSLLFRPLEEQKRLHSFRQAHEWKSVRPSGKWKIISVEPNPNFCAEFKKMGLEVLEYAACAQDKGQVEFHISPHPMSCSALEVKYPGDFPIENGAGGWWDPASFTTVNVEALTLNTILQRHHPGVEIDVLLVDVEGWELDVLRGLDFEKFHPKVVCVENVSNLPEYHSFMKEKGYKLDRSMMQDELYITSQIEAFRREQQKKRR